MVEKYMKMYKRMTLFILISTVIGSVIIYRLLVWYNDVSIRVNNENILESEVNVFVLFWGMYIMDISFQLDECGYIICAFPT